MTKVLSIPKANFGKGNRIKVCMVAVVLSINHHFKQADSLTLRFQNVPVSWANSSLLHKTSHSSGNFWPFCAWEFLGSERIFPSTWTSTDAWGQFFCYTLFWSFFEVYHSISEVKPKLHMLSVHDPWYFVLCHCTKSMTAYTSLGVWERNLWKSCTWRAANARQTCWFPFLLVLFKCLAS